ncbi:MAG: hypothetical protein A3B99_02215 [Candidatus Yanofskybacteria bacterium RIFCSPHIGHO2_02_FULL_44_12b]|uniref:Non-canonical purine NTP pyrophosphatase n=2 Tax=Candidatus Yanofskyibacteriota TaxID=1752733 RepID=A0A1F8GQL8_9BACT|nr:MAG: Non-canonical purine NTP pyrophosphatase [Candidatus Yanofskybacteria bacterium GW2011_GWA2_44_9]OGN05215.1 MAG: hypothetical protein A2659_04290 [Candidatus Yanofskybacteria bacterium RIFCSPHIGHO2_01_FULL_44_24]OGN15273.1 MAG: hypothetical protein A3B99_02215 [Candidatus Yanofskybacteria bacterium RIFCSPHIGHO2_02_FULL_44_12b]OGN26936.1 MAG: hypothetical protein A2925_01550 [Candidatus Yanofskybacteria bacterium RIFCSPLOWO2_01_FULL_44_22]
MKILIATKNPAKAREVRTFLGEGFKLVSLFDFSNAPDVEETGKTFEANSLLKARTYFEWSGLPSISDDGGLEIDYLNGEPGVLSRRWPGHEASDQELIDIALKKLKGVPKEKRTAHLRTVGTFYDGTNTLVETASIDGYIVEEYPGKCEPGYPFRSIFWIPQFHKLYQDLSHEEHDAVNHRRIVYTKLRNDIMQLI